MGKVNSWITGIYLHNYETDMPDGTLLGFDADFGEMYALKGKLTHATEYRRAKKLSALEDIRPLKTNQATNSLETMF